MTVQKFIEKAIEGGWRPRWENFPKITLDTPWVEQEAHMTIHKILLDPLAWKAVGKVEGWDAWTDKNIQKRDNEQPTWLQRMHRMVDALAEGKTIIEYLETL